MAAMEVPSGIILICVYPGADGCFSLFSDDGCSYVYEKGEYIVLELRWNDVEKKLTAYGKELARIHNDKRYSVSIIEGT